MRLNSSRNQHSGSFAHSSSSPDRSKSRGASSENLPCLSPNENKEMFSHDAKIEEMMKVTNLSRDECFFYLESMSWDFQMAVDMWSNLNRALVS
jgi:hypothetical protein